MQRGCLDMQATQADLSLVIGGEPTYLKFVVWEVGYSEGLHVCCRVGQKEDCDCCAQVLQHWPILGCGVPCDSHRYIRYGMVEAKVRMCHEIQWDGHLQDRANPLCGRDLFRPCGAPRRYVPRNSSWHAAATTTDADWELETQPCVSTQLRLSLKGLTLLSCQEGKVDSAPSSS